MKYNIQKHSKTLELYRILELLANEASLQTSKEEALKIIPCTDLNSVKSLLDETDAAFTLSARFAAPSFGNLPDVSSALTRADVGAVLSVKELLDISETLRVVRTVKNWRDNCDSKSQTAIDYLFSALYPNKFLEDRINSVIKSEDEIYDKASPLLFDIRRKISSKSVKIREMLDKTVRGPLSKYLQDAIITQRDGRFVVPVRLEYKNEIKGIVHDTSSSGQTLFIEPMSVVEANNDIRVLKVKEEEEITRILAELSALSAEFSDNIKLSYKSLTALDLIFAKAKLAYKMNAVVPEINDKGIVDLIKARHPLIDKKHVVPINIAIGTDCNTLVITGPNTGGKTVALKTVGLFCLMTMCGLMIPAGEGSKVAVFDRIFADIGDEQSIEQSLSTFSSHMVNIISILKECNDNSLVLFDELCAGTDPVEGAALAKAILINLSCIGARSIVTTHYPELKTYALDTPYVQNASCEFDIKTLKPTYRLIIGMPGRSNAFAISKRLGLPEDVILLADKQISDEDRIFERVVTNLENARQSAEEREMQASNLKSQLEAAKEKSDSIARLMHEQQEKMLDETRAKAADIIENARYKSGLILNELEELKKNFTAENAADALAKARKAYKGGLNALEEESDVITDSAVGEQLKKPPMPGDTVIIASIGSDAAVLETDLKKKRAYVMSGAMKMWVGFDGLLLKSAADKPINTAKRKPRTVSGVPSRGERIVSGELDIRGLASDEAIIELDKYIDEAVLSGIDTITVIHGKGTGVLRKAVQAHLRKHKNIKNFRVGTFGEGENGVTIAEIKP